MALTTITSTGASANRIDIVFLGDGYAASEISTIYSRDVNTLTDYLFNGSALTEPFGRYAAFFNVHRIDLASVQSGADNPGLGTVRDTALDSSFYWDGVTERLLYVNGSAAKAALSAALTGTDIDAEMVFIPVNTSKYGGGGGQYAVYAGSNGAALEIAVHEVGHSFADLADEYGGTAGRYPYGEPAAMNITTDASGAKWSQWLGYTDSNTGTVGAYEGGHYYDSGVYRPSNNSKMQILNRAFDPVAREQFILKFYDLVDPLDSYTLMGDSLSATDLNQLAVTPVSDSLITVEWSIDHKIVQADGNRLNLQHQSLSVGTHTITARAYDGTDWVRVSDRSALEETVTWDIQWTGAVPSGVAMTVAADSYVGNGLDDVVFALAGADTINGSAGDDLIYGNIDNDHLMGGFGVDTLFGGQHADLVAGDYGDDIVYGNKGDDIVSGGMGNDILYGGQQNDLVIGHNGNDRLDGNRGDDTLSGADGVDIFVISNGSDIALDFTADEDLLQTPGDFASLSQSMLDGNLVISNSAGGTITLIGQSAPLAATDFLFV